jgi:RNA polymerase sigma-70 factor (family 1)
LVEQFSEWSRRLQASDQQACSELFEALHRPLLRYAIQLLKDEDAAYDVVQDTFVKIWTVRAGLKPDKSLKAYMYTIVRNRSLNHLRQRETHESTIAAMHSPEIVEQPGADEVLDAENLGARIREWISELPPKRREAFQLSRFDGLSHEEIAEVMNVAPRTVTNHIMLALQHLRDRLKTFQTSGV